MCLRSKKERRSRCSAIENSGSRLYWVRSSGQTHGFGGGATASLDRLIVHLPARRTREPAFVRARHGSAPFLELIALPNRGQTNEYRVRLFEGCDAPQRAQFHANPTQLVPGLSSTNGERYASRTEGGLLDQRSGGRLSTRSTGLMDSRNCVETQRGI